MIKKGDRVRVKVEFEKLYHQFSKRWKDPSGQNVELSIVILGIDESINEANVTGLWKFVPMDHLEIWKPKPVKKPETVKKE